MFGADRLNDLSTGIPNMPLIAVTGGSAGTGLSIADRFARMVAGALR